ncbi:MAG: adaptor protein MecA [Lachnospiraceae bacterium]|nr:adaptor protein MecA [Lachnospiraceae bacterium]
MKIEKINDQQIKCTLTRKELEKRELKLTEIAYGNEKVKTLFRDMMREAELIYGFEADDVPLMIEVIPYSDRVVVLVTKVEEPDELDTRFSRFAPSVIGSNDSIGIGELFDNLLDLNEEGKLDFLPKLAEVLKKGAEKAKTEENSSDESEPAEDVIDENEIIHHFFIFDELSQIIDVAKRIPQRASYDTRVFKNEEKGFYLLRLSAPRGERGGYFFRVYQILSEFGRAPRLGENFSYYVEEHCVPIIESNALQTLRNI